MGNNTITMMKDEYENGETGEKVQGITIIVDGKLKQAMDAIVKRNPQYDDYTSIVRDAFLDGLNRMILGK